jgi:hypothetical protein
MTATHNSVPTFHISTVHASLIVPPLRQTTPDRLEKAILGLADGSLVVTRIAVSEAVIQATVTNGTGTYTVTLAPEGASCTCDDFTYRKVVCKHQAAVCVFASQPPFREAQPVPSVHLAWTDGARLCGDPASRSWVWPWTGTMLTWPEACPQCVAVYQAGYNNQQAEQMARRPQGEFTRLSPEKGALQLPSLKGKKAA